MVTLQQILNSQSTELSGKKVKLVRHKDSRVEYRHVMKDRAALLQYQAEQPKDVFKGCDYIISFIGRERSRAVFVGVYAVKGCVKSEAGYEYDLEEVAAFKELEDRLVIDWGGGALSWHQWYDKHEKQVIEFLPKGYIGHFPGLLDFVLEYDELKTLVIHAEANYEWQQHLSAVNGVYMLLDSSTGMQYIGSACGAHGIWQRWCEYATTGHGHNKELVALLQDDLAYSRHFRFSVLQALPSNITQREIVKIEALYKQKLGSRAHGLNRN